MLAYSIAASATIGLARPISISADPLSPIAPLSLIPPYTTAHLSGRHNLSSFYFYIPLHLAASSLSLFLHSSTPPLSFSSLISTHSCLLTPARVKHFYHPTFLFFLRGWVYLVLESSFSFWYAF